jgi:hypothetical protein
VTLLNLHKPRDRSHYERFAAYHESFYRAVEATSVTPFAPRALDRGLPAVVVSLARHGAAELTGAARAAEVATHRSRLGWIKEVLRARAERHTGELSSEERQELGADVERLVDDLLDTWVQIAEDNRQVQVGLQYGRYEGSRAPALLHEPLDPELRKEPPTSGLRRFKAQWSLRDVEPEVPLIVRRLDGGDVENP